MLVNLIAHTNDPEKTIAAAAKLCYSDAHIATLLDGLTPGKTAAFLQRLSDASGMCGWRISATSSRRRSRPSRRQRRSSSTR